MSRHHQRAARRERQLALALGTVRVRRERYERAPDVAPVKLPNGETLVLESKERSRPLATAARWLSQCESYAPAGGRCAVVVFATGQSAGDALVLLRLRDLRALAGLGSD